MHRRSDKLLSIVLISPSIIAVGIFVYGFILWSVRVSLSDWQGLIPNYEWVGFQNYTNLLSDARFHIGIRNTIIFTTLFVGGCLILGLGTALILDRRMHGHQLFRNLFLFPMAISLIVTGVVWRWLMNPATGDRTSGLNLLFDSVGLDFLINQWHTTPNWGMAYIAIPAIWQMSGYTMALYLGGLSSIPVELREAARVDGANELQIYRHIVLPLLRPITLSALIVLGHISLKVFDLIIAIAGRQVALDVPAIYMWSTSFDGLFFSRGAAISIFLLLSVAVLIIPYLYYNLRQETEV